MPQNTIIRLTYITTQPYPFHSTHTGDACRAQKCLFYAIWVWEMNSEWVWLRMCGIHAWWLTVAAVVISVLYLFNSASLSSNWALVCLTRGNLVGWRDCLTHVVFSSSLTFPSFHSFRLCKSSLLFFNFIWLHFFFFFSFFFLNASLCPHGCRSVSDPANVW